jgi:HK97 family phage portal protein
VGNSLIAALTAGLAPRARMASAVPTEGGGWFNIIREPFSGAWQSAVAVDSPRSILAFSAVFACVTRVASDIAKLCVDLVQENDDETCSPVTSSSPYWAVLRKPNHFQNRIKFIEQWVVSKLLHGNLYALKRRDLRGIVTALYILDPMRVTPLITDSGDVYYRLKGDQSADIEKETTVPASEIIHDMMVSLWHPLVGVSPLYACAMSATMGNRIQTNSTRFFQNLSRPSGILTTPEKINDEDAKEYKARWEENYGGGNVGRVAVLGGGLKYEGVGTIPPEQAQLIDQLKWTVEDVARCFGMPLFKIGGPVPAGSSIEALNLGYYTDCLQALIESAELCLDEGLELPSSYHTEFDLEGLLRMDQGAQYDALEKGVRGMWMAPNDARRKMDLPPVDGGESPLAQQQNFSLAALAKRDALPNPFVIDRPEANPTPSTAGPAVTADPEANPAKAMVISLTADEIEREAAAALEMELA